MTNPVEELETSLSLLEMSRSSEEAPADDEADNLHIPPSSRSSSSHTSSSDLEAAAAGDPSPLSVRRWIVNEDNLLQLFGNCH